MICPEERIESGIRDQVHLLHENGFNTICSCGRDYSVQLEIGVNEVSRLDTLLLNNHYRNYRIELIVERHGGNLTSLATVRFSPTER
jgi:hypothetical protein